MGPDQGASLIAKPGIAMMAKGPLLANDLSGEFGHEKGRNQPRFRKGLSLLVGA